MNNSTANVTDWKANQKPMPTTGVSHADRFQLSSDIFVQMVSDLYKNSTSGGRGATIDNLRPELLNIATVATEAAQIFTNVLDGAGSPQ
jgi:hypothetical protein